jgi:lipopolysaccharide export system protein LptC
MFNQKLSIAILTIAISTSLSLVGCSSSQSSSETNPSETATTDKTTETATTDGKGTLQLVANGEDFVRQGFVTKDGWQISFDNVFVTLADVTAYQSDPPYNADSDKAIASQTKIVLLEGQKVVDLAEGDDNADLILTAEVEAATGMYNALTWKVVKAENGEIENQAILLKGQAEKEERIIDFAIAFDKELEYSCGEFVGDNRKGIVKNSETSEIETTFHFDHIFGDAEAAADEHINTGSIGFDPFAALAEDSQLDVDLNTLKERLDAETYQTLESAIVSLGHVGEGHCREQ